MFHPSVLSIIVCFVLGTSLFDVCHLSVKHGKVVPDLLVLFVHLDHEVVEEISQLSEVVVSHGYDLVSRY